MKSDREIAAQAMDLRKRGKDIALVTLPAYATWSERELEEGESPALIAHLDALSIFILPEEADEVSEEIFDELLGDLKDVVGD